MSTAHNLDAFQKWIWNWMQECFGPPEEIATDRGFRFLEEALELSQAVNVTREDAHKLVDYVFDRDPGVVSDEVGDVLLTLAGVASANDVPFVTAAHNVTMRAVKNRDKIIAKRKLRPTNGPLPTTGDN